MLGITSLGHAADAPKPSTALPAFKTKLETTMNRHLNQLLNADGSAPSLKGKSADGNGGIAFYLMFEVTHDQKFRQAALGLADEVLKDMRAIKFGVLPIKEKEKPGGKTIIGGGPPALGAYAAGVAYIPHQEGGRNDDLQYIATVLDNYPWSEEGWWASTIDVATGESKLPMTKPAIINKTAAVAMAAGIVSAYVRDLDPKLSANFHVWGCEFTPARIKYYFDGKLVHVADATKIAHGDQNIWLTCIAASLGDTQSVDDTKLPALAEFDWVRFYHK